MNLKAHTPDAEAIRYAAALIEDKPHMQTAYLYLIQEAVKMELKHAQ